MKKLTSIITVILIMGLVSGLVIGCQPEPTPPTTPIPRPILPERPKPAGTETAAFPDKNLEAAMMEALGKPAGEGIKATDLDKLTTLCPVGSKGIVNLSCQAGRL